MPIRNGKYVPQTTEEVVETIEVLTEDVKQKADDTVKSQYADWKFWKKKETRNES